MYIYIKIIKTTGIFDYIYIRTINASSELFVGKSAEIRCKSRLVRFFNQISMLQCNDFFLANSDHTKYINTFLLPTCLNIKEYNDTFMLKLY